MPDIDYDALATVARSAHTSWEDTARAVVAAYRKQMREKGVVEVRRDALIHASEWDARSKREILDILAASEDANA